ncbi:hypothetical protein [Halapricum sp. CBA1109]|nr:hypothetical protein [Halapricum sp. CBA1109]
MSSKSTTEASAGVEAVSGKSDGTVVCFWSSTAADCETLSR